MSRSQFCSICTYFCDANEAIELPPPTIMKPIGILSMTEELWTGKQVISVLLVPSRNIQPIVNIEVMERNYSRKDNQRHFDMNDG